MLFIWESVLTLFAEVSVGFGCSAFLVSLEYDFVLGIGSVFMLDRILYLLETLEQLYLQYHRGTRRRDVDEQDNRGDNGIHQWTGHNDHQSCRSSGMSPGSETDCHEKNR